MNDKVEELREQQRQINAAVLAGELTRRQGMARKAHLSRRINKIIDERRRERERQRRDELSKAARKAVLTRQRNEAEMDPDEVMRKRRERGQKAWETRRARKVGNR